MAQFLGGQVWSLKNDCHPGRVVTREFAEPFLAHIRTWALSMGEPPIVPEPMDMGRFVPVPIALLCLLPGRLRSSPSSNQHKKVRFSWAVDLDANSVG